MQLVVADTGPIHYLVLIGQIEILPALFEAVILPSAVRDELAHAEAPPIVREWIANPPGWLEIRQPSSLVIHSAIPGLGPGQTAAIAIATEIQADLLLMDDRRAVSVSIERGLAVTGTLGLLSRASKRGLLDLAAAFEKLKQTNFRHRQEILDALLRDSLRS